MTPLDLLRRHIHRRTFIHRSGLSLGSMALASLLNPSLLRADAAPQAPDNASTAPGLADSTHWPGVVRPLHHPARIKRVIWLYMAGGPSHLETLDHKPKLAAMHGQPMPESLTKGQPIAQLQGAKLNCFGPQHPFARYGKSGQEICSIFPHIGSIADDICIIRSLHTEAINHDPAHTFMNTGTSVPGRPAMGSWLWYGLGSECDDLPGFIVLASSGGGQDQPIAARQWHSGFLPSRFQGVEFRSKGDPVLYVRNPAGVSPSKQRDTIDAINAINRLHADKVGDPEIHTRISQYEMAFKMQTSVPELMDISNEPKEMLEAYGAKPGDGSFASNCLLARRMAERGVRFIQLYHRGWDHHGGIKDAVKYVAGLVDKPSAALVNDLKNRGMLDETLVLWSGEFGRTPMAQGNGRDHHMKGFSMWMAGGGVKGGISYGATDELGYNAVENPVHPNDLHATVLHLLGIDHARLTYRFSGRDFRLTDVGGHLLKEVLV
jgi:hypothetical protein